MNYLKVGVNHENKAFIDGLTERLYYKEELHCVLNEYKQNDFFFVICINQDSEQEQGETDAYSFTARSRCKTELSNILTDLILKYYEDRMIEKIVQSHYDYFEAEERKTIAEITKELLREEEETFNGELNKTRKRNLILKQLTDYFEHWDDIIIDGFVNFRLKDYMESLKKPVFQAVDKYAVQKEYKIFLKLLTDFADAQEPQAEETHLIPLEDGTHLLVDEAGNNIVYEHFSDSIEEFFEITEGNEGDVLLSMLLTLSPKKVFIHHNAYFLEREIYTTITKVFAERCFDVYD